MKSRRPARLALMIVPAVILTLMLMMPSPGMAQDGSGPYTSQLLNNLLPAGNSLITAGADTGPTVFTNNEPFPSTNNNMEPISVNFSDPDGIYPYEYPKMFYDGYELTKCGSNMPGVTFTSGGPNAGITWDHETVTMWGPSQSCREIWDTEVLPMTDGQHTVTITVKDGGWSLANPNGNQTTFAWTFFIDNTPPVISSPAICGTLVETNSPTLSFGYSDASGIDNASVKMYIDGFPTAAGAVYTSAAEAVYTPTGLGDGVHTAMLNIKDNGGNPASSTCSFTVDTQPPVISAISPADGERVGTGNPLIDVDWLDMGAGVDQYTAHLELDGVDVTRSAALGQYGLSYQASGLALGTHTVSVYVKDKTGKQSLTKTSSFRYSTPITYYAPWYDSKATNGMNGNWIMISNQETTSAVVDVYIGSEQMVGPDGGHWNIAGGGRAEPAFGNRMAGPVRVVSTNGNELLVSQRVLYKSSFNEVPAVRENELDSEYRFTWYDSKPANNMSGNWILIGNVDPSSSAVVDVYVGASTTPLYTGTVAPGGIVTPGTGMSQFNNLMDGPVKVKSRGGEKLIVSQRVLYKDAFSEVMGTPISKIDDEYYFTWYDWKSAGMNGNYILVSNESASVDAYVDIEIGGNKMNGPTGGQWKIAPGDRVTPFFQGVMDGPVKVSCASCAVYGSKIMASQRVIYKNSFEEVQGLSPNDMGDSAVFTWYDWQSPQMKGDWVLIGNQDAAVDAYMQVYIGSSGTPMAMSNGGPSGFTAVKGGGITTPFFTGIMGGPVKAACSTCAPGQKLIISQRVLYLDSFNEVVGRPPVK